MTRGETPTWQLAPDTVKRSASRGVYVVTGRLIRTMTWVGVVLGNTFTGTQREVLAAVDAAVSSELAQRATARLAVAA